MFTVESFDTKVFLDVDTAWIDSEQDLMDLEVRTLKAIFDGQVQRECASELELWGGPRCPRRRRRSASPGGATRRSGSSSPLAGGASSARSTPKGACCASWPWRSTGWRGLHLRLAAEEASLLHLSPAG